MICIWIEYGFGEGILISGYGDDDNMLSIIWGLFLLDFFF